MPKLSTVVGLGLLVVVIFSLCFLAVSQPNSFLGWFLSEPEQREVEISAVATIEVDGCEYLVFSTGEICHKGDCKACREWLLSVLAAQSAMEEARGP